MKKILFFLVVAFFLATNVWAALVESTQGPQFITTCYITDMGDMTSGDVVVLQTTSPTYWGREVTGTTTAGLMIYGVCVDDPTATECANGTWIRVQTTGYCPIVKMDSRTAVTVNTSILSTGGQIFSAAAGNEASRLLLGYDAHSMVTGSSVALESKKGLAGTNGRVEHLTIKAILRGL